MAIGRNSLEEVEEERPYPEYSDWWKMGTTFVSYMSSAILTEWEQVAGDRSKLDDVRAHVQDYMEVAYGRSARQDLVNGFVASVDEPPLFSGEFDALSYAFFRSAFDMLAARHDGDEQQLAEVRRAFARKIGTKFFEKMADHLSLELPHSVANESDLAQLQSAIESVGQFLEEQGYLRDHFAFKFDVDIVRHDERLRQPENEFIERLQQDGVAYAVYEMGYPVILPSAAYLYNTVGEAQHHSSRIIEELFQRSGLHASETDDFDPTKYEANLVVEVWEIRA